MIDSNYQDLLGNRTIINPVNTNSIEYKICGTIYDESGLTIKSNQTWDTLAKANFDNIFKQPFDQVFINAGGIKPPDEITRLIADIFALKAIPLFF